MHLKLSTLGIAFGVAQLCNTYPFRMWVDRKDWLLAIPMTSQAAAAFISAVSAKQTWIRHIAVVDCNSCHLACSQLLLGCFSVVSVCGFHFKHCKFAVSLVSYMVICNQLYKTWPFWQLSTVICIEYSQPKKRKRWYHAMWTDTTLTCKPKRVLVWNCVVFWVYLFLRCITVTWEGGGGWGADGYVGGVCVYVSFSVICGWWHQPCVCHDLWWIYSN